MADRSVSVPITSLSDLERQDANGPTFLEDLRFNYAPTVLLELERPAVVCLAGTNHTVW